MNKRYSKYSLFLILVLILLQKSSFAQTSLFEDLRSSWAAIAGWWLMFVIIGACLLFIGAVLIRTHHLTSGKSIFGVGLVITFIAMFMVEYKFFEILTINKIVSYKECKGIPPVVPQDTNIPTAMATDFLASLACIITGYVPEGATPAEFYLGLSAFFIFAVIMPLALSIAVMVWALDWIHPTTLRNIMALCIGLLAFRGFFVTLFVEFLTFGAVGIVALLINIILIGALWRGMIKLLGLAALISGERTITYLAHIDRLLEEEKEVLRALELEPGDVNLRRRLDEIRKELTKAEEEARKAGVKPPAGKS
ncbi:MAG: hypothetical protein QXX38_02720 [Candidatus Aenigmatarchaeota archaeon]